MNFCRKAEMPSGEHWWLAMTSQNGSNANTDG